MDIYGYSHLHTKYTDGDLDLSKIKELLLNQGASFAFITEHREYFDAQKYDKYFQECRQLSDDKILFIPGLEIAVGRNHILVLGVEKYYEDDSSINLLKRYKADGNLIIWAHPHRSRYLITADVSELLDGIEIWNSSYDTKYFPRFSSLQYAEKNYKNDGLLFAGLDFHRLSHLPGPKIFLTVDCLSSEEIIKKIKAGEYQIGNKKLVNRTDLLGEKYYYYFCASLFCIVILKLFKVINSTLLALNIKAPIKIKNYLRKKI